jgi:hypothetical protein
MIYDQMIKNNSGACLTDRKAGAADASARPTKAVAKLGGDES